MGLANKQLRLVIALIFTLLVTHAATASLWTATPHMTTPRCNHAAALLPNGKVILTGGVVYAYTGTALASTELFNPATATWSVGAPMANGRELHAATVLKDGNLLVTGGYNYGGGYLWPRAAELYNANTGTWSNAGSLNQARLKHAVALLADGRVLVAGGSLSNQFLASSELYNPATRTWTITGSLNFPRSNPTATLLPNGKVLVTGGYADGTTSGVSRLRSAELYDPATGKWTLTGSMISTRDGHTATLLPNGKVLVEGGRLGGFAEYAATAELYDPATGVFTATGTMNSTRTDHTATLLPDGKVLVAGGYRYITDGVSMLNGSFAGAELYDPATGLWTLTESMITRRDIHTATLLPTGKVLLAGGENPVDGVLWNAEIYNWVKGTATVTINGLNPTYDGTVKNVSIETVPPGLPVRITYDGGTNAPISAGSSQVIAIVDHPGYVGGATNIMTIARASATVTLGNLFQVYDGTSKFVSVSTVPAGLPILVIYDGFIRSPTDVGTYPVFASVTDLNYQGSATNVLTIGTVPVITRQPVPMTNNIGQAAAFSVTAEGTATLQYQWRNNGNDLAGATGSVLTLPNIQLTDAAEYSVVVTNSFGVALSSGARLFVKHPPIADASATRSVFISPNDVDARAVLNGSRSFDADGDRLQYTWYETGNPVPLSRGAVSVVVLPLGSHSIVLAVSDGLSTVTNLASVEVITITEAVQRLLTAVRTTVPQSDSMIATLSQVLNSVQRKNYSSSINLLLTFQQQVQVQVMPGNDALANALIDRSQEIISALRLRGAKGGGHGAFTSVSRGSDGRVSLQFSDASGAICVIEASVNLMDWEPVGIAVEDGEGHFSFEQTTEATEPQRFYRYNAY